MGVAEAGQSSKVSNADEPTPEAIDPNAEPETIRPSATGLLIPEDGSAEATDES